MNEGKILRREIAAEIPEAICEFFESDLSVLRLDKEKPKSLWWIKILIEPMQHSDEITSNLKKAKIYPIEIPYKEDIDNNSRLYYLACVNNQLACSKTFNLYTHDGMFTVLAFPILYDNWTTFYTVIKCGLKAKGNIPLSEVFNTTTCHENPNILKTIRYLYNTFSSLERIHSYVITHSKIDLIYKRIGNFMTKYGNSVARYSFSAQKIALDATQKEMQDLHEIAKVLVHFSTIDRIFSSVRTDTEKCLVSKLKKNKKDAIKQKFVHSQESALHALYREFLKATELFVIFSILPETDMINNFGKDVMDAFAIKNLLSECNSASIEDLSAHKRTSSMSKQ